MENVIDGQKYCLIFPNYHISIPIYVVIGRNTVWNIILGSFYQNSLAMAFGVYIISIKITFTF